MKKLLGLIATLVLLVMPMAFAAGPNGATAANPTVQTATYVSGVADELDGAATNPTIASTLTVTIGTLTTTPTTAPVTITISGNTVEDGGAGIDTVTFSAGAVSTDSGSTTKHFSTVTQADVTAGESELATGTDTYTITVGTSTKADTAGGSTTAAGGVVSQLDVDGTASTSYWQGFVGQASGTIELADAAGNQLNTWTVSGVSGNVFFGTAANVDWSSIDGDVAGTYATAEDGTLGMTGATDSVSSTMSDTAGTGITSAVTSADTEGLVLGNWEMYLYRDTTNTEYLYTTAINPASIALYDGTSISDGYQIIVPTGNAVRSTYYVFVELA